MTKGNYIKYISFIHYKIRSKLSSLGYRPIYTKEFDLYEAKLYIRFFPAAKIKQSIMPNLYFTRTYIRRDEIPYPNEAIENDDKRYNQKYICDEKLLPLITSHLFSS